MRTAIASLAALALVGCAADPVPSVIYRSCPEPEPERPTMPTEHLGTTTPNPDQFTAAAIAEIERREGYETMLRTALRNCKK